MKKVCRPRMVKIYKKDVSEIKTSDNSSMSVFVVEKHLHKICHSTKTLIKSLMYLVVKLQRVKRSKGYSMWDVLLSPAANCEDALSLDLITKDFILRTEYEDRWRNHVSIFKVPSQVIREHLAAYWVQFGQILNATTSDLNRGWRFEIMLD